MTFLIDLHVHTTAGSADSSLRAPILRERALTLGLHGVHITEHFRVWQPFEAVDLAGDSGLVVLRGMEWNTELGHILVLGVDTYRSEIRHAAELRSYVDTCGGLMIAAHPFRHAFDPVPVLWKAHKETGVSFAAACGNPVFALVDAVETLNGACTDRENALAAEVAAHHGLPGVGGSDAHYPEDVGRTVTILRHPVADERELIAAIRNGCARAAAGPAAARASFD